MPELPEVETVCRGLEPILLGATLKTVRLNRPNLRFPFPENFAATLEGQEVVAVRRRAKYILVDMKNRQSLIIHLGMSGRMNLKQAANDASPITTMYYETDGLPQHNHVVFTVEKGGTTSELIYNDARRFGFMDLSPTDALDQHPFFASLGVEPLSNALNGPHLLKALGFGKTPLKTGLLDQRRIAGLGNIYVCEALFRTKLSPWEPCGAWGQRASIDPKLADDLAAAIKATLMRAIEKGGSTLRDHRSVDGGKGGFQDEFLVYGREGQPCTACQTPIARETQSGRSTFFCPSCQTQANQI